MKRILMFAVLSLAGVTSMGCSTGGSVEAEVPSGSSRQNGVVESSGTYALYHATKFDIWGTPVDAQMLYTAHLQAHDPIGFRYGIAPDKQFSPDAQHDVIAYAGSYQQNLGPLRTMQDRYYWASPAEWDMYRAGRPARVLTTKLTMH